MSCPTISLLAAYRHYDTYVIALGAAEPLTFATHVELATDQVVAIYALPSVVLDRQTVDPTMLYRSGPIVLNAPHGSLISLAAIVQPPNGRQCEPATRNLRAWDDQGLYQLIPITSIEQKIDSQLAVETTPATPILEPSAHRDGGPPADCKIPNREARVLRQTYFAPSTKAFGTVIVKVSIAETGAVTSAVIYKSGGNAALDRAALEGARASLFSVSVVNCIPTAGSYLMRTDYTSS